MEKKWYVSSVTIVRFRMKVAKPIQTAYPIHCQVWDSPRSLLYDLRLVTIEKHRSWIPVLYRTEEQLIIFYKCFSRPKVLIYCDACFSHCAESNFRGGFFPVFSYSSQKCPSINWIYLSHGPVTLVKQFLLPEELCPLASETRIIKQRERLERTKSLQINI